MIRHARAAVLAGAVLCAAWPAAALDADWWQVDETVKKGDTVHYLVDLGSAHEIAPGVSELRLLRHVETNGETVDWTDVALRLDCAGRRARNMRLTEYDARLTLIGTVDAGEWISLPAGHPLERFGCKGERDFKRLPDFVPPMDAPAIKK